MSQRFEAPNDAEVDQIARMLVSAIEIVEEIQGEPLDWSIHDLRRLNATLASGQLEAEATWVLECLGLAFGKVFVNLTRGFDWWIVVDENGRTPCLRYGNTALALFPQTMLSKRLEAGRAVDVPDLFKGIAAQVAKIRDEHYPDV